MVANVEARRETDGPVHYPPTVAHYLGCVLVFAARRQANHPIGARGVCGSALKLCSGGQACSLINGVQSPGQNRTREIRPSGIAGRL